MNEKISQLKEKLETLDSLKSVKKEKDEIYKKSIESSVVEIKDQEQVIVDLKTEIDKECLAEYDKTKVKDMYGGLKIKEYICMEYGEEDALNWAREKGLFLTLDKKKFEKNAENLGLDFVTIDKKPKVTYPKVIKLEG